MFRDHVIIESIDKLPKEFNNSSTDVKIFLRGDDPVLIAVNPEHQPIMWNSKTKSWEVIKYADNPWGVS